MKISYAITVCNELEEIEELLPYLFEHIRSEDEVVVLYDKKNGTKKTRQYLNLVALSNSEDETFRLEEGEFEGHFANWKNKLSSYCNGDYIFQIDADEIPNRELIRNLPDILQSNPDNEVYLVPRVNTVEGLTQQHIEKWRWNVNEKGWVNWPDYQYRIWKNKPKIRWKNKVHEVLEGMKTYAPLPPQEEFALYHHKHIERQEKQNEYYNKL